ncbi:hypothetical protein TR13x_05405 [Caloranaerobacter sp. TR13]|uniref:DUF1858 domain-containing protein n=1 Tax=Caloranaerobacter sp. TR13 TaxID=1302151 RepID=UPI0006D43019|nr:DUF1858 domain-containing protein [Caloranaerobacter sp. TR13]KPU27503.1 hypothetical protein TR13x_05405 [Caloranaerobacter sp. TR13]
MKITKDMIIFDIIKKNEKVLEVLKKYGLYCNSCNAVYNESIEVASRVHHVDLDKLLEDLNSLDENKE